MRSQQLRGPPDGVQLPGSCKHGLVFRYTLCEGLGDSGLTVCRGPQQNLRVCAARLSNHSVGVLVAQYAGLDADGCDIG